MGSRRTSVSSEKAALMKDEDNLSLPDVEEGQETKQNFVGFEEGNDIVFLCDVTCCSYFDLVVLLCVLILLKFMLDVVK